jgi:hypothetical protein
MNQEFPLLNAALGQSLNAESAGEDVGRVLDVLGIQGATYHSFEPPEPVSITEASLLPEEDRHVPRLAIPSERPVLIPSATTAADARLGNRTPDVTAFILPTASLNGAGPRPPSPAASAPQFAPTASAAASAEPRRKQAMSLVEMFRILAGAESAQPVVPRSLRDVFGREANGSNQTAR